ncbi:MAG TPA: TfoX/Sxy family protein [Pseudomonadales bacterium]
MRSQKEFVQFIVEGLAPLGTVTAKRMFGGDGIFREGLMFGLVSEDTLYFKVDEALRNEYAQLDCEPFTYTRQGKRCHLGYFSVPAEALEDTEVLRQWALKSWQVAVQAHRPKSK